MNQARGMALPVVMSLIVILVLIAMAVASSGIATLNLAGRQHLSQQSVYAAEAGIAAAFREIIQGTAGWTGYSNVAYGKESRYSVETVVGPSSGPGHPDIPAGAVYLLATGTTRGSYPRRVGVLVTANPADPTVLFNYLVASAGDLDMKGNYVVDGSIKASRDIDLKTKKKHRPFHGNGRILSGRDITVSGQLIRDPSQDMRARDDITISHHHMGTDTVRQIYPNDTSPDSAPFISDGRFTNTLAVGEIGEVLPNPDPVALLGLTSDGAGGYVPDGLGLGNYTIDGARTDVVQRGETSLNGLALDGKINFFPNGIRLRGNDNITGQGSIVTGGGQKIRIEGNQRNLQANLLALRWVGQPPDGEDEHDDHHHSHHDTHIHADIQLDGRINMKGLILAHQQVEVDGDLDIQGMIISHDRVDLADRKTGTMAFDSSGLNLPGLETWLSPPPGPLGPGTLGISPGQTLTILCWQRL